jgi:hypothetical protein
LVLARALKRTRRADDGWVGMDDYSALAYRIAGGVADVRGCLILSRDGLILGSYPDDETAVKPAWVRFASLGDPERSFVEFGDQVWVYVRRPAYGAFAVANAGVRPGLVIDQLEGILRSAEEARSRRDTLRVPEASSAPSGKPRTSLHPAMDAGAQAGSASKGLESRHWSRTNPDTMKHASGVAGKAVAELPAAADGVSRTGDHGPEEDRPDVSESSGSDGSDGAPDGEGTARTNGEEAREGEEPAELDPDAVVDPVLLAKEFSGLLQVESGDDEASS